MHMRRTAYHDTIGRPPWAHAAIVNATQALSRKSSLTTRLACEKRDFRIYIQTPIIFTVIPGHYFITSINTASHPYPSHPGDLAPAAATEILPTCSSGCTSRNVILICLNNLPLSPSPSVVPFLGPSLTCGLSRTTADTFIYNSGAVSHGAKHDHRCHEQYCQPLQVGPPYLIPCLHCPITLRHLRLPLPNLVRIISQIRNRAHGEQLIHDQRRPQTVHQLRQPQREPIERKVRPDWRGPIIRAP